MFTRASKPHPTSHSAFPATQLSIKPSALSVDVVNLCNLRCKHCFWDSYDELIQDRVNLKILDRVDEVLKQFPAITNITWYGGEPLINHVSRQIVRDGVHRFKKNNLIITNGTHEIPKWEGDMHFAVSLDGTAKYHNYIRGKDVYQKAKKNILAAMEQEIPVGAIYCINAGNIKCIPAFLEEWRATKLDGVVFTTYTPLKGRHNHLELNAKQQDRIADFLLDLKKVHQGFIYNSEQMIELLRPKYNRSLANLCPMNAQKKNGKVFSLHLCNDGSLRLPCAIGPQADHERCRNITKVALYAGMILKDKASRKALLEMYHSRSHGKGKRTVRPAGESVLPN